MEQVYVVQQVIKYSDGSETVINYSPLGEKVDEIVPELIEKPKRVAKKSLGRPKKK